MKMLWVVIGVLFGANAGADPATTLAERLIPYQQFSSAFVQDARAADGQLLESRTGQLAVDGVRRMFWETESPYAQTIVADGQAVYVYDPDLAQVQIRPLEDSLANSPMRILGSGAALIARSYRVSRIAFDGGDRFRLEPIERDQMLTSIELSFEGTALRSLAIQDGLGQSTVIRFVDPNFQPPNPLRFRFDIPPEVDVIDGREAATR